MSTSFNSGPRSPATSSRLQLGGVGGLSRAIRSSSSKKPPEPLRRAIADCLSSSLLSVQVSSSALVSEASRTLRVCMVVDFLILVSQIPEIFELLNLGFSSVWVWFGVDLNCESVVDILYIVVCVYGIVILVICRFFFMVIDWGFMLFEMIE